jgi:hypothetical protein
VIWESRHERNHLLISAKLDRTMPGGVAALLPLPALHYGLYEAGNSGSCFVSVHSSSKKRIVWCFGMADVGTHGEVNRSRVKTFRSGSSTNSRAVFATSVIGDAYFTVFRTACVTQPDLFGKSSHVIPIGIERVLGATSCPGRAPARPRDMPSRLFRAQPPQPAGPGVRSASGNGSTSERPPRGSSPASHAE